MKHKEEILLEGTQHDHWISGKYTLETIKTPLSYTYKILTVKEAVLKHFTKGTKEAGEHKDMPLKPGVYVFGDLVELDITKNEYVRQAD